MVSEKKKDFVQKLTEQLKSHPVIALVNMQSLPAPQLQTLRAQLLKKEIIIVMARKRLLQLALKNSAKENIDDLTKRIKGMPALLLSKENPFLLYSILQKNKSPAPAKANQIAPRDVVVPAGPTSFAPGPIISELASVGIKTKVDNGKLAILEDTVVVKEDEPISAKAAEMLKRLDIQPMEIGLDLIAAWEKGTVFEAKQLFIDEEEYSQNITRAFQDAFNLSLELALPTADNIEQLLQKAFRDSKNVAIEQSIINSETRDEILAKTERQALSVKEAAGNLEVSPAPVEKPKAEALKEEPAAEKPEEKPAEEKKAEKPAEPEAKKEAPVAEKPAEKEATPAQEEKDEPQAEKPVEEPQEEKESETPAPEPAAEPAEEKQAVEEPVAGPPEPEPEPEPTPEPTPEPEPQPEPVPPQPEPLVKEAAIPTAAEMIAETKKQYAEKQPEVKEQVSAEQLVAEELAKPKQPKQNEDVKEAENLFEKLKKEGTLRQEE